LVKAGATMAVAPAISNADGSHCSEALQRVMRLSKELKRQRDRCMSVYPKHCSRYIIEGGGKISDGKKLHRKRSVCDY